jgi:hypothetical protein
MTTTKALAFDAREFIIVVKCIMKLAPNETKRNETRTEQSTQDYTRTD